MGSLIKSIGSPPEPMNTTHANQILQRYADQDRNFQNLDLGRISLSSIDHTDPAPVFFQQQNNPA